MTTGPFQRGVILVEGQSDRIAIETLAKRAGINLTEEGIEVVEMGGATSIGSFLERYGQTVRLAGLYDAGEAQVIARNLKRAGIGMPTTSEEMAVFGFFRCVNDLEDELIRAVGLDTIEEIVQEAGDARPFRTFRNQPEWRDRPVDQQFRRFLGSGGRRKVRYARYLIEAANEDCLPDPLLSVVEYVRQ